MQIRSQPLPLALALSLAALAHGGCLAHNVGEARVTKAVAADSGCDEKKITVHQENDVRWRVEACGTAMKYQCRTTDAAPDGVCMKLPN